MRATLDTKSGTSDTKKVAVESATLKPPLRTTVTDVVTAQLREAIIGGEFPDGSPLRQDALSDKLGVSRIPVREALARLEAEGLAISSPHKGYVVSAMSREDILELFELRLLLEPELLRCAIPKMTEQDLEVAERALAAYNAVLNRAEVSSWGEHNKHFHLALYAPAGRRRMLDIVGGLLLNTDRYTRLVLTLGTGVGQAKEDHDGLMEYCRRRSVNQAVGLVRDHIERAQHDLLHLLDSQSDTPNVQGLARAAG